MSRLKDSKNVYDNIPIPDRLRRPWPRPLSRPLRGGKKTMESRISR